MNTILAGHASTNSRGKRPLPPGTVSARTLGTVGVYENVEFSFANGRKEMRELLTWTVGQWGGLWGSPQLPWYTNDKDGVPTEIAMAIEGGHSETPGSYGHAAEWELADALGVVFDHYLTSDAMSLRFFQSGGEACAAAARIARRATGREFVASSGYHGAAAEWAHPPADGGIPPSHTALHKQFDFGNTSAMRALAKGAACIMVEVPAVSVDIICRFLLDCRQACDENKIPLIIDDVVCGFRLALAGSCERYGVKADMIVLGKAMSVTGCVSAVIGRNDLVGLLDGGVFFSTTFGGSPGPCSVAAATVKWLADNRVDVYGLGAGENYKPGHLHRVGRALQDGFNALGIQCIGQPERSIFQFPSDDEWLAWCSNMIGRGIMCHRPNFPTLAHTMADVEKTLAAAEALRRE